MVQSVTPEVLIIHPQMWCNQMRHIKTGHFKAQTQLVSVLKAATDLLTCLLHHFLSNLHSLLLHKKERPYVPSSLTSGRKAEGKHGKCSPKVNRVMKGKERTEFVCVRCVFAPLLAFLSSRHQRRWSWRHSGTGCALMMSSLIHHCQTGWSD